MIEPIYFLEKCLLTRQWMNVDELVNYVVSHSKNKLSLDDISKLTEFAAFELSHGVPLRQFV